MVKFDEVLQEFNGLRADITNYIQREDAKFDAMAEKLAAAGEPDPNFEQLVSEIRAERAKLAGVPNSVAFDGTASGVTSGNAIPAEDATVEPATTGSVGEVGTDEGVSDEQKAANDSAVNEATAPVKEDYEDVGGIRGVESVSIERRGNAEVTDGGDASARAAGVSTDDESSESEDSK